VQVPYESGPVWGLDIICVDTPSGKVPEKSSSYDMSVFSSGADPKCAEVAKVASEVSSPSIGELWPDIDKLDEIQREDAFVVHTHVVLVHGRNVIASAEKADWCSRRSGDKALLSDAPEPSNIKSKGHICSSVRTKVVRILSTTLGAISPCI
jgi:hypothetical protein